MEQNTLYRKFRPKIFDEVVGQDVIVRTLRNQIQNNKVGHAYLFCGTRGTGKTTIAKIFARSINCKNQKVGNPCNECETCKSILNASNLNVLEIDAASNNGIDDIRRIISLLNHPPVDDERYKVFIIDEAHSLSNQASNALLKTLEEPPEYAVFILCTTEPEKLLETIRSRCQRYDFTRIELDTIKKQLKKICDEEKIDIDDDSLTMIATKGDGSMRDSISLLERCRGFIKDEKITIDVCKNVLGTVDYDDFIVILEALLNQDTKNLFEKIAEIIDKGKDINVFVSDFVWFLRNVMIVKTIEKPNDKLSITKENFDIYKKMADKISIDTLIYYIEKLSELEHKLKNTMDKRIILETSFLKLSIPKSDFLESSFLSRISKLEVDIKNNKLKKIDVPNEKLNTIDEKEIENKIIKNIKVDKATYEDIKNIKDHIKEIVASLDIMTKNMITQCNIIPTEDKKDGVVNIVPPSNPIYNTLIELDKKENILDKIEESAKNILKKQVKFVLLNAEENHMASDVDIALDRLDVPIEEI